MIIGLFGLQLGQNSSGSGLLSNSLISDTSDITLPICTKPEKFSQKDESAWCSRWLVVNIEENKSSWKWNCLAEQETYTCHFTENRDYPTRWGILFKK